LPPAARSWAREALIAPAASTAPVPRTSTAPPSASAPSSTSVPPARTAWPDALIWPRFETWRPIRNTSPARAAMDPWFTIAAVDSPLNLSRPAMKSSSLRFRVEARKPAVSIRPPGPTTTPLGLIRNTRPLASRSPWIRVRSPPVTRLRIAAAALGWSKRSVAPAGTDRLGQLTMAFWLDWVTVVVEPDVATPAWPETTDWAPASSGSRTRAIAVEPTSQARLKRRVSMR
jgi:hypothetical protein